jgi:hypothetical protein
MLDDNGINYSKKTIMQASHLKEELETLGIHKDECTLFSISADASAMYPSIKFGMVKRAV